MCEQVKDEAQQDSIDWRQRASFLKYCSDDKSVIKGIFEDHKIRFTQPWALNDPLEFNPTLDIKDNDGYRPLLFEGGLLPSGELRLRFHLIELQINRFGILSLTKIPESFDMWSRYANGHHGFLMELKSDFNEHQCMLSMGKKPYLVREVQYVERYAIDIDMHTREDASIDTQAIIDKFFYRKTSRWAAEHEYRLVRPFSDLRDCMPSARGAERDTRQHLLDFSLDCLESVTFGACMAAEKKRWIMRACEGSNVKFLQALIVRDHEDASGKMGMVAVRPVSDFVRLLDAVPGHFIVDNAHVGDRLDATQISSLSELPYWNDDPAWAKKLYENRKKRSRMES